MVELLGGLLIATAISGVVPIDRYHAVHATVRHYPATDMMKEEKP